MKKILALICSCSLIMGNSLWNMELTNIADAETAIETTNVETMTSSSVDDTDNLTRKTGNQIELYLGGDAVSLSSVLKDGYLEYYVDDSSIVEISGGKLIAKEEGFTYITSIYSDSKYIQNIVVHSGISSVSSVYLDGVESTSVDVEVGQSYQISVNNGLSDLSELKVTITTEYGEDVDADDFVIIDNNGTMTIIGMGEFDVKIRSTSNRIDTGANLHVSADISDTSLKSAIARYFNENNYELMVESAYTYNELKEIKELTFYEIVNADNEWLNIVPNLVSIYYDLRSASESLGSLCFGNDAFNYQFIGNPNKNYSLTLSSQIRNDLGVTFVDFNYSSSSVPFNLSNVSSIEVIFKGKCSITSTTASGDNNGNNAITAVNLSMELLKDAEVTINGGNGGSGTLNTSNPHSRNGGAGISVDKELNITAKGYSTETNLTITGGDGGDGNGYGNSGGDGGDGISAQNFKFDGYANFVINSGSGGDGYNGKDGEQPDAKPKAANGSKPDEKGSNGATGDNGGAGQDGGAGGSTGIAINATNIYIAKCNCIFKSGQGGNGGDGGDGGTGGTGGQGGTGGGGYKFPWWYDGDGGNGGNGGVGGTGGNGGNGGDVNFVIFSENADIINTATISIVIGTPGKGGDGGNGGQGGKGGQGGNASTGNADSATNGNGGYGGQGGNGGDGGDAGQALGSSNISMENNNINVTQSASIIVAASGGSGGVGGYGGNHGNYDNDGVDRSNVQAKSGADGADGGI